MRLPSLPRTRAGVEDRAGGASARPAAADLGEHGRGDSVGWVPPLSAVLDRLRGVIDASVPFADCVKIRSNDRLIVSVKT